MKRANKDEYIREIIRESGLEDHLENINNPEELFIVMTYIEAKLDSYGQDDYKTYNKYFEGYFGLNDYTDNYGITLWDKISGNEERKRLSKERYRRYFEELAEKLRKDFEADTK